MASFKLKFTNQMNNTNMISSLFGFVYTVYFFVNFSFSVIGYGITVPFYPTDTNENKTLDLYIIVYSSIVMIWTVFTLLVSSLYFVFDYNIPPSVGYLNIGIILVKICWIGYGLSLYFDGYGKSSPVYNFFTVEVYVAFVFAFFNFILFLVWYGTKRMEENSNEAKIFITI